MFGLGLIKGLFTTGKRFLMKKVTQGYPEVPPDLPPRSRGSFGFDTEACISCGLCVDACPNRVIRVDYFTGENKKRKLDKYTMNLGYCLFCGLCVEICPTDAVVFKTDFALACFRKDDTVFTWKGNAYRPPESPLVSIPGAAPTAAPAAKGPGGEGA